MIRIDPRPRGDGLGEPDRCVGGKGDHRGRGGVGGQRVDGCDVALPTGEEFTLTKLGGTMCAIAHDVRNWAEQTARDHPSRPAHDESPTRA
jgi:hypothetical protein